MDFLHFGMSINVWSQVNITSSCCVVFSGLKRDVSFITSFEIADERVDPAKVIFEIVNSVQTIHPSLFNLQLANNLKVKPTAVLHAMRTMATIPNRPTI